MGFYSYYKSFLKKEKSFARLVLLVIAAAYIIFGVIFYSLATADPVGFNYRLLIALALVFIFIVSFVNKKVKNNIYEICRFCVFVALLHLLFMAYVSGFSFYYIISLLMVIVLSNLFFNGDFRLLYYNLFIIGILSGTVYFSSEILVNKKLFLLTFILMAASSYFLSRIRFKIQEELKIKSSEYETILDNTEDAIFLLNVKGEEDFEYLRLNKAHERLTGLKANNILGETPVQVMGEKLGKRLLENYQQCVEEQEIITYEEELEFSEGVKRWETKLSPVIVDEQVVQIVGVSRDITEQRQAEKRIRYLSFHDSLTGLYNRTYFKEEIKRYNTRRQLPLSIIIGDVNGLKITNDAFGHQKGDDLLVSIAEILKESCRQEDLIARWGGDEFIILLPRTESEEAEVIMKRIKDRVDQLEADPVKPSISLGFATKKNITQKLEDIFKEAEDWMYKRKLVESENVHSNIISSLKQTLYQSSHENYEHCQRLKELSLKLGRELNLSDNELIDLELLAELHDLGKVAVPEEILEKYEELTPEEEEQLQQHPEMGYQIAKLSPQLKNISEYMLSHHEWWDGSGYPRGLQGEEIPYLSRILSVVNEFDKMTHYHPHVDIFSQAKAVEILKEKAGTQFDPDIVEVFVKNVISE